jgi:hypothetical protein
MSERQSAFEGPENFFPKKFGYTLLNDASGRGFHIRGPGFELRRTGYDAPGDAKRVAINKIAELKRLQRV